MPSNQSSPWDGGKLHSPNENGSNTATAVKTHTCVPVTEVPFTQTSSDIFKQDDLAKPLPNFTSLLRQIAVTSSGASAWENGDRNKTNNQSQFTALPEGYSTLPQIINGVQIPNQIVANGLKPAESSLKETIVSSSFAKRAHNGQNCLSTDAIQVFTSLQTSQPEKGSTVRRYHPDSLVDAKVGLEPQLSVNHQDLFVQGQASLLQTDKSMAVDCSTSPPVPAPCLNPSDHRGPTMGEDTSSRKKTEKRSTIRETFSTKRCHSARLARKYHQKKNSCSMRHSHNQLQVKGCSPAVLASTKKSQPQTFATLSTKEQVQANTSEKRVGHPLNVEVGAAEEQESKPPIGLTDVASVPVGTSVGSVTTQISAIQLTKPGQPGSMLSSSPYPSYCSPSPTEECQDEEDALLGQECFMQVDGLDEDFPDELENACSDDDNSDCSSINGALSTVSFDLLSGVEEPMSVGQEDDREEKPALVPSLFPFMHPTLYFSSTNEKVELLPVEQRRLLKWKMSNVTPNVVKHTIARSHFRVTKKSNDWLGCWGHHMKSVGFKAIGEHQKLNHFPGTFQIGRKDRLWRNLSKMQVRFGKQEFSFFPRTFILPQDIKLLRKAWEDGGSRQKWIIKPPASARGLGIQVIHKWSQMPRKRPLLVQKYLHKPYLISGNKFDLRIYVYVTSYEPLRIYIFTDGLVRFASCKYSSSMKTLSNKFMHLTNYSINKNNADYQANSDDKACQGHKWAVKALWQYLGSKGVNTGLIWEKIKDIVIKTIIASEPYVNNLMKQHVHSVYSCHELFGFDIMLDENLKPWLLEVNISPSLHSNSALDASIKGQMIRDLLNLAGYRIPQKSDSVASGSNASSSTSSVSRGNKERTKSEIIADEKVKRAFYLSQRFADQDFLSTVLHVLTPEDVRVLAESENELLRRGQFERVFPSASSSRYLRFFECPRYLNILLDQWERKHWRDRATGVGMLQNLCLKGVHLGTNDPAHIWSKSSYISKYDPCRKDVSQPRVVVSHHRRSHHDVNDNRSDGTMTPISGPVSPSPGPSVPSSTCMSPQPGLTRSLLPHHFASL